MGIGVDGQEFPSRPSQETFGAPLKGPAEVRLINPTFDESGLPGYESIGWFGFIAPAGTPTEIIAKLNGAIVVALKDPGMLERTRGLGAIPMPLTPTAFARHIRLEYEKWTTIVAQWANGP